MTDIDALLKFDPIDHAEKLAGGSYKTDESVAALGMLLTIEHGQRKAKALQQASDSFFGIRFNDFVSMAESEGFTVIASRKFVSRWRNMQDNPYNETIVYMWNPDGVLLTAESYSEDGLNTARIFYNLDFGTEIRRDHYKFTSSGHFMRGPKDADGEHTILPIWVGDDDVREGFRHKLNLLRQVGFLPTWKKAPFMWLLNYMDSSIDGYDYEAINAEVIASFPVYVQKAIAGE